VVLLEGGGGGGGGGGLVRLELASGVGNDAQVVTLTGGIGQCPRTA
jgi:hypothetical protein